jgi:hypothetical protein
MIARNTCSPSREIAAHHHRNAQPLPEVVNKLVFDMIEHGARSRTLALSLYSTPGFFAIAFAADQSSKAVSLLRPSEVICSRRK